MIKKLLKKAEGDMREETWFPETGGLGGQREYKDEESGKWVPFASFCTTGQFKKLGRGYVQHCGPTAAVNLIKTLENYDLDKKRARTRKAPDGMDTDRLFLMCAEIGRRTRIYWNTEILGRFGGTSNPLTTLYLRACLRAAGKDFRKMRVRFHLWITPDALEKALRSGAIVYLQVYRHPKYRNHHMLCYGFRYKAARREFLLADGWSPGPVWLLDGEIGHGHYLTIRKR